MTYTVETDLFAHKQIRIDIYRTLYHKTVFNSSRCKEVLKKDKKKRYAENFRISFLVIL